MSALRIAVAQPVVTADAAANGTEVRRTMCRLVDRYDKRKCSHTETTRFYSPGFEPVVFDVDGFRFGCALCIEVNFTDLFGDYERRGVDCVLLSAYPVDSVFAVKARALAAINNYWLSLSVPAQSTHLFCSGLIAPNGDVLAEAGVAPGLVVADLDRDDPALDGALNYARPWRATARSGEIYEERRVSDPRSAVRTEF